MFVAPTELVPVSYRPRPMKMSETAAAPGYPVKTVADILARCFAVVAYVADVLVRMNEFQLLGYELR